MSPLPTSQSLLAKYAHMHFETGKPRNYFMEVHADGSRTAFTTHEAGLWCVDEFNSAGDRTLFIDIDPMNGRVSRAFIECIKHGKCLRTVLEFGPDGECSSVEDVVLE